MPLFDPEYMKDIIGSTSQNWLDLLGRDEPDVGADFPGVRGNSWLDYLMPDVGAGFPSSSVSREPRRGGLLDFLNPAKASKMIPGRDKRVPAPAIGEPAPSPAPTAPATPGAPSVPSGSGVKRWIPLVSKYTVQYGVPIDVALGILDIESGGNPEAKSPMNYNAKTGAELGTANGLMQVLGGSFDPDQNVATGVKMLADGFKRFGSWDLAAAAYFGAIKQDDAGNWAVADWKDVGGMNGPEYVRRFNEARSRYAPPGEE